MVRQRKPKRKKVVVKVGYKKGCQNGVPTHPDIAALVTPLSGFAAKRA